MKNSEKLKRKLKTKKYLKAINKIEKIRSKNNSNWMDILRLAIKHAPEEAVNLMKRINQKDQVISKLFNKIK